MCCCNVVLLCADSRSIARAQSEFKQLMRRCKELKPVDDGLLPPLHILHPLLVVRDRPHAQCNHSACHPVLDSAAQILASAKIVLPAANHEGMALHALSYTARRCVCTGSLPAAAARQELKLLVFIACRRQRRAMCRA